MSVTQAQIARDLNLHQATVSRCFISPDRVDPTTLKRVIGTADRLGYRRHTAASAMRRNRVGAVGLLLGNSGNENFLPLGLLKNMERQARQHDQRLIISHVLDDQLGDPEYVPGILRELAVDGLIIDYIANSPQHLVELLDRYRVPAVWLNSKRPHNSCYVDDVEAGHRAAAHFADAGHHRLAFVAQGYSSAMAEMHYSQHDRAVGMAEAAAGRGCEWVDLSTSAKADNPDALDRLIAAFRKTQRPTAVFADSLSAAMLVYTAARAAGLKCPDDVSMLGVGSSALRLPGLAIDTLILPQREISSQVLAELNQVIADPNKPRSAVAVRFGPIVRGSSTAPPSFSVS